MAVRVPLNREMFQHQEALIAQSRDIAVHGFRYASGVEALRVTTDRAELIVLPFKGQQVWRATFDGRDITMGSMFAEPRQTKNYLETYGAFLIHCGLTAMGVPSAEDDHPLHGELPNADMDDAHLLIDDVDGHVQIVSSYQYTIAFTTNYRASPSIKLKAGESHIDVALRVENLRQTPIELMYLAHANFRPVDHGKLIYAASYTPEHVRVRQSIPSHISPAPEYKELVATFAADPQAHHIFDPSLAFDPEMVFQIDAIPDAAGLFHAMQMHPNGGADFISYRPDQAPVTMRWICRTADQQGLGIAFPATAGVEGYQFEKSKGRVRRVAAGETWSIEMRMGTLDAEQAGKLAADIDRTAGRL